MKRVAIVLLVLLGGCRPADFHFADGATGRYADWNGRWIVLNYWAEWCEPCRREIPELNTLYRALGDGETRVIGVNYDGLEGDALRKSVQSMGVEYPVMTVDPRERYGIDLPAVLPTTVIIDPTGKVVAQLVGPQTATGLKAALGVSAPL